MNLFIRYKVIIWILTGILIVTLSVLGSVIYFSWKNQTAVEKMPNCSSSCQMMTAELELSPSQNSDLEEILDRYRDTSEVYVNSLREDRMTLMEELRKENPDTLQIRILAREIGNTQALLTSLAAHQYLQIRQICDSCQRLKLADFYCELFGCPRSGKGKDQGRFQYRHGQKKTPGENN